MKKDNLEQEFVARVTESQGIVHKICNIYCKDEEHRKDLFQEILIQLWKSYTSFRGEAKFSTWMYRVGLNVAIQYFRKGKKRPEETELSAKLQNLPELKKDDSLEEEIRLLYKAINTLNDIEKAIVMLYLEEKTNEEIAEITGITQNYVRVKMNRVKTKLKKILNP
ncbi:sigma-70 family RNA polymerase sigma factor [Leptobacterium flavescens]|uniref:Sigma-70 family RNA polymerase sigma factor n=1 Tax=Leptobacterium flavescens TaxID=472055 RepID=A0A6P0UHT6_9FLAO|nr:sigma-70 family RNA polymerase sigma factor [Leptobacterium flavescens]NER12010.1 sigma-70 family RNA polymerase sigma factor [Leptobacterium flavescens]